MRALVRGVSLRGMRLHRHCGNLLASHLDAYLVLTGPSEGPDGFIHADRRAASPNLEAVLTTAASMQGR